MCPPDRLPSLEEVLPSWDKRIVAELSSPATVEEAFRILDRDGDGELDSTDLVVFFEESMRHSMSQEEAQAMIAAADLDGKGSVNFSEFLRLVDSMRFGGAASVEGIHAEPDTIAILGDVFGLLDVDKDGLISPLDLRSALPSSVFSDVCIEDMLAAVHEEGRPIEFGIFAQLIMNA